MRKHPALLASVLSFGLAATVIAQPIVRTVGLGQPLAQGTSTNVTVGAVAQTVSLTVVCTSVTINNTSSTNTIYIQPFGGTATTSNFPIAPGQAFTWNTTPGFSSFSVIASGAGTVVGVLAH